MTINDVLSAVQNDPESIAKARKDLAALGVPAGEIDFEILIALGGSDVITADGDGTEYYDRGDGKRVRVDSIRWPK